MSHAYALLVFVMRHVCLPQHVYLAWDSLALRLPIWILLLWIGFQGPRIWLPHPHKDVSLSLYSKGGLDIGFGSWQDVDAKKAALLVKSYLSITRGWTKDCVRECKLGRSTNPNRYTPMSSSWCWWVCFLFHACELFSYLGWFGHLFVYLIFIIPIMIIFGFGCFEICHLFLTSCQGHYVISQVAWTLYPICWLTVLASWHRSLQCNPQIKHVEVPKKTG